MENVVSSPLKVEDGSVPDFKCWKAGGNTVASAKTGYVLSMLSVCKITHSPSFKSFLLPCDDYRCLINCMKKI